MENKELYYTPDIKEFHIGFEYEYRYICLSTSCILKNGISLKKGEYSSWIKEDDFSKIRDYDSDSTWELKKDIKEGNIRVKHLDKEDIESLGFKYQKHNTFYYSIGSLFCRLETIPNSILIKLDIKPTNFNMILKIKNISELRIIMNQLGINGE